MHWHHAAVTYDGCCWQLYLDGMPETDGTTCPGAAPGPTASNMPALDRNEFKRRCNFCFERHDRRSSYLELPRARKRKSATINSDLTTVQSGLVARWGRNEGIGTTIHGTADPANDGSIHGTDYAWTAEGAPFDIVVNEPPDQPTVVSPVAGETGVSTSPMLEVTVTDPEPDDLTVAFYGR